MVPVITAEHFSLTPIMRDSVEKFLSKIDRLLPEQATIRFFLRVDQKNHYRAVIRAHFGHEELIAEGAGYDFHSSLSIAVGGLKSQILKLKNRNASKKHHIRRHAHAAA